jgi:Protein of unknown function (DUF3300)
MRFLRTICWICAFLGMLHVSIPARSQSSDTNTQTPGSVPAQPPSGAAAPVPDQPGLKPAELDALVAPIALYPDTLLANVLMASTYPLEVVRAERWVNLNKKLKDDALKAAAEKQPWDASVQSLVAAPAVLQMLSERLDWTQKLGEAFLAQEPEISGRLRACVMAAELGSRAAADTVLQHSESEEGFAAVAAGASAVVVEEVSAVEVVVVGAAQISC